MNILLSEYNFDEPWIKEALEPVINKQSKVCIIPFSFKDWNEDTWKQAYGKEQGKYYHGVIKPFLTYGVLEEQIVWLNYFTDTREDMIHAIKRSDIVFFTGGLPEEAVKKIRKLELIDVIREKGKVIIGASAGALMQLSKYYLSPDEDYDQFMYERGIGLLPFDFHIEVHYNHSLVQKECIQRVLDDGYKCVYAIGDHGGIIVNGKELKLYGDVTIYNN